MYALRTLSPDSDGARLYARWIETLWGELPLCRWLRGNIAVSTGGLPYACGAYVRNRELVAGAALLRDDMEDRPEWNPWLGCLIVRDDYRRQGLAGLLVADVIARARALGFDELYLFCKIALEPLYLAHTFARVELREYEGRDSVVMRRAL